MVILITAYFVVSLATTTIAVASSHSGHSAPTVTPANGGAHDNGYGNFGFNNGVGNDGLDDGYGNSGVPGSIK